jgi:hypothetical protein
VAKEKELGRTVAELLQSESGPDYLIITMGFIAGWEGVTMLDYLVKSTGIDDPNTPIGKLKANANALESDIGWVVANSPTGALAKLLGQVSPGTASSTPWPQNAIVPTTEAQALAQAKAYQAKLGLACMGAVVSYAVTRPGFLPALMGMAGDIIKDVAAVPIAL